MAGSSFARCPGFVSYQTEFQVLSCQDEDPKDHAKILGGAGVVLEVSVLSKKKLAGPETHDWWLAGDELPLKMKVFYETRRTAPCVSIVAGTKMHGKLRALCCDGGEPRCDYGASVQAYDLKD